MIDWVMVFWEVGELNIEYILIVWNRWYVFKEFEWMLSLCYKYGKCLLIVSNVYIVK